MEVELESRVLVPSESLPVVEAPEEDDDQSRQEQEGRQDNDENVFAPVAAGHVVPLFLLIVLPVSAKNN